MVFVRVRLPGVAGAKGTGAVGKGVVDEPEIGVLEVGALSDGVLNAAPELSILSEAMADTRTAACTLMRPPTV